jgi:ATP phosphoribosyltransferase regulatory subunit HisZ
MMSAPDVSGLLVEMSQARKTEANGGPISEVLSKLVRMLGEVNDESRKRAPLVALVSELEEAREELAWVTEWERDEGRYKVSLELRDDLINGMILRSHPVTN